jgi:dipeptidyl aminopeptidase/acylaminoacyl peptidase
VEILIGTRFADTVQLHRVTMPGGARTQVTFFPDRVGGALFQPTRGEYFVFSKDVGGGEWYQNYRYDLATGKVTLLTDGKSRNSLGEWSSRGDRMVYTSTRRTGKDNDFYVLDPADPTSDRLLTQVEGGGWFPIDWSPDDRQILAVEYVSVNESYLWLVDAERGKMTLFTPKGGAEKVSYQGGQFSRDGKGIYVTTDKASEFQRLAYVDLAGKDHRYLTAHINWDVEEFDLSDDGTTIAFVTNEDGVSVLRLLDTATGRERPAPTTPTGVIGGIEWHKDSRHLAFGLESARSPSDVYSLDAGSGTIERWTQSETGGVNAAGFSEPELVAWKSFDGRRITGFLYRPPATFTGKRPVIVSIHGGPEGQARPGYLGRNSYYVNELGVAMIFPNVRGSQGYGKTFLTLDNALRREDSYRDVNALFDWIAARPDLDAGRILVTGGSYGGFMTFAIATNYDERICCSISVVGISNLRTFLERTEAYRRDLRRAEYGDERDPKTREFFERIAAVNNAGRITKPIFVVQGKNDPRVPWTESQQIVDTLQQKRTPVWYLLADDEGHGFAKKKNADFQFYASVTFVQRFLLGQDGQKR